MKDSPPAGAAPSTLVWGTFYQPLHPENRDQGDPYVLQVPRTASTAFAFYTYVTGEASSSGRAFPVYGSNDLLHWECLGGSLVADVKRAHWAPCVRYIPTLQRPYVMLYSRAIGLGEQSHVGHTIRRADSTSPEGPFLDSGHVLTSDRDFAIDPDVYRLRDGSLRLAFATDFVADHPLGTGIVEARISEDLTELQSAVSVLARAKYGWQIYDRARRMPWKVIPGVDWDKDTVEWYTVEAPSGGLVSPKGQDIYLYSGGCFFGYYAIGAIARDESGRIVEAAGQEGNVVVRPQEDKGFFAPGHCCWLRGRDNKIYLMFHARYGSRDAPRQMTLAPLLWSEDGLPYCPARPDTSTPGEA